LHFIEDDKMTLLQRAALALAALALAGAPASAQNRMLPVDRSALVGTTAATIMAPNGNRAGFSIQNQSASATCYLSTIGTATADQNSLMLAAGSYYETPPGWVTVGALSVICSGASTPVFAREW
ncbi:hypothetical protein PYV61_26110, partial [Roseisolibacter sp. H3M3-2]